MPVPRITREDLKARLDAGDAPVILDARLKYPYEHSTVVLPGAMRLQPEAPDLSGLSPGRDVVVYDSDPDEIVSAPIVATLIDKGIKAAALKGGIGDWMAANLPTEPKGAPRQAAPQPGALKG
jgi:rhodanese-related sulfurtransferase